MRRLLVDWRASAGGEEVEDALEKWPRGAVREFRKARERERGWWKMTI